MIAINLIVATKASAIGEPYYALMRRGGVSSCIATANREGDNKALRLLIEANPAARLLSIQWPWRINPAWTPRPALNLHYSLLPAHRGMYPIAHAILAGDEMGGVTLHEIDADWDTGPIVAQSSFCIRGMDAARYYDACVNAGAALLQSRWLSLVGGYDCPSAPQGVAPTPYHCRDSIDFARTDVRPYLDDPVKLDRFVRAMHFPAKQTATLDGFKVVPRA